MANINQISDFLTTTYQDLSPQKSWGETSFFYNPNRLAPHGTYFFTIKQKNGANDKASNLDRDNVYRLNFRLSRASFIKLFKEIPDRPAKGQIVQGHYDFTKLNMLTPHPIYGWMLWMSILKSKRQNF